MERSRIKNQPGTLTKTKTQGTMTEAIPRPVMWDFCGWKVSKDGVTYFSKTFLMYVIVLASVVNVSLMVKPLELWITLLVLGLSGMGINMAREKHINGLMPQTSSHLRN